MPTKPQACTHVRNREIDFTIVYNTLQYFLSYENIESESHEQETEQILLFAINLRCQERSIISLFDGKTDFEKYLTILQTTKMFGCSLV